jgi:glycosyltransferase involved in cell wall biosynthesis
LEIINPLLLLKNSNNFQYRILICGRGLPGKFNGLQEFINKNIVYAGFVDDISVYFKGADVFINPVVDGGGIKTKLVEAIGSGTPAVSTLNGSIGIGEEAGKMLSIVHDADWDNFVKAMINITGAGAGNTPVAFYEKFYWGNIVKRAVNFIQ